MWRTVQTTNVADSADDQSQIEKLYDIPSNHAGSRVWKYFGFRKIKDRLPTHENLQMKTAICKNAGKNMSILVRISNH